ncbi:MAG: hypothetical protein LLG04_08255 [Parachlamydia sp.]|nr:hypothetical protein [Parachlamydia sp.]
MSVDDLDIADGYFPQTQLHPFTFHWLKAQREAAITRSTHPQFEAVKREFQQHLDQRISTLSPFINTETPFQGQLDLWTASIQKPALCPMTSEKLLEASLHIQDILFNCEEVLSHLPTEAENFAKELEAFMGRHLAAYLHLLPNLPFVQSSEIDNSFKKLQTALLQKDISAAHAHLAHVRNHVSGISRCC